MDFSLDSLASLQHKGFAIEPSRGSVERGQTRTLSVSWAPPADFDVGASGRAPRAGRAGRTGGRAAGHRLLPPPLSFQPDHPLLASALLQLRGDVKETYKVFFVARVLAGP